MPAIAHGSLGERRRRRICELLAARPHTIKGIVIALSRTSLHANRKAVCTALRSLERAGHVRCLGRDSTRKHSPLLFALEAAP